MLTLNLLKLNHSNGPMKSRFLSIIVYFTFIIYYNMAIDQEAIQRETSVEVMTLKIGT